MDVVNHLKQFVQVTGLGHHTAHNTLRSLVGDCERKDLSFDATKLFPHPR